MISLLTWEIMSQVLTELILDIEDTGATGAKKPHKALHPVRDCKWECVQGGRKDYDVKKEEGEGLQFYEKHSEKQFWEDNMLCLNSERPKIICYG